MPARINSYAVHCVKCLQLTSSTFETDREPGSPEVDSHQQRRILRNGFKYVPRPCQVTYELMLKLVQTNGIDSERILDP